MNITANVPVGGLVRYLDFNYGTSNNTANHEYYTTSTNSNGAPLVANTSYNISVNELDAGNLYWSVTARNDTVGITSNASNVVIWPGANVTSANTSNSCNTSSSGTLVTTDPFTGNIVGGTIIINSGTGTLAANTIIANVVSNTQFNLNFAPTVALANACISITTGGITGNNIQPGTITYNNLTPEAKGITVVTNYDVANSGSVQVPVAATSTSTRNIPLIYPGSSISSTVIFPYAQGTASTSIGYSANSTGAWTPFGASILYINNSAASYDNWYKAIEVNLSQITWDTDEFIVSGAQLNMYTDTPNTWVQIAPYARFSNDPTRNAIQTQYLTMTKLDTDFPYNSTTTLSYNLGAASQVVAIGLYIRNITNSSNLTIYAGSFGVSQRARGNGSFP